jgi:hypothetical protein
VEPIGAYPGHVPRELPHRPLLRRGAKRELLGREIPQGPKQQVLMVRPSVCDDRQGIRRRHAGIIGIGRQLASGRMRRQGAF